jgi:hypothetical protein
VSRVQKTRKFRDLDSYEQDLVRAVQHISKTQCSEWYVQQVGGKDMWYIRCEVGDEIMAWNIVDHKDRFDVRFGGAGPWVRVWKDEI